MSLPYFPLYPTDFEAKTSHLTIEEDGAYNRLLRLCWMTHGCSLPDDDKWIMRRMRVDKETYDRVVLVVLDEFFERKNGRVSNAKLSEIFQETNSAHKRRVDAGSKGGKAKSLKTNKLTLGNAKEKLKQPEPELYIEKEDTNVSSKKSPENPPSAVTVRQEDKPLEKPKRRASRLPADWAASPEQINFALMEGLNHAEANREADKFRDYWLGVGGQKGTKLDWNATWKNWVRRVADQRARNPGARSPHQALADGFAASVAIIEARERRAGQRTPSSEYTPNLKLVSGPRDDFA